MLGKTFARTIRTLAVMLALVSGDEARAEGLPQRVDPFVTDLADMLSPADEATLARSLATLRAEHGIEMSVVTIASRAAYDRPDIETLATDLFNTWGIGDPVRNDGILVLVSRDDREIRIELGTGYDRGWNPVAQEVIDDAFLPHFRNDNMLRGILTGTDHLRQRIALPFAEGRSPEKVGNNGWIVAAVFAAMAALIAGLRWRQPVADILAQMRACPACGHRGMEVLHTVTRAARRGAMGRARREVRCPRCDHRERSFYSLPLAVTASPDGSDASPPGESDTDGGGRSSGGGASGSW